MTFGAESDEAASQAILDVFVEAGRVLIDTADARRSRRACFQDRQAERAHERHLRPDAQLVVLLLS
jgi:aryl-alcohol dehydrogenase-like predicted oxidoreductase